MIVTRAAEVGRMAQYYFSKVETLKRDLGFALGYVSFGYFACPPPVGQGV